MLPSLLLLILLGRHLWRRRPSRRSSVVTRGRVPRPLPSLDVSLGYGREQCLLTVKTGDYFKSTSFTWRELEAIRRFFLTVEPISESLMTYGLTSLGYPGPASPGDWRRIQQTVGKAMAYVGERGSDDG